MNDCSNCSLEKRIDRLEQKVEAMNEKVISTDSKYGYIMQAIGELKIQVDSILKIPNKRWETVVAVIITVIVTVAVESFIRK